MAVLFWVVKHHAWANHAVPFFDVLKRYVEGASIEVSLNMPFTDVKVLGYGDVLIIPRHLLRRSNVVFWHDSPLAYYPPEVRNSGWQFLVASRYNMELMEYYGVKNITYLPKPVVIPPFAPRQKSYDICTVLTQDRRKGADQFLRVLYMLDKSLEERKVVYAKVHDGIFEVLKNARFERLTLVLDRVSDESYSEVMSKLSACNLFVFPSNVEGIGLPPIEAALIKVPVIMGDIRATNEFIDAEIVRIRDVEVEKYLQLGNFFILQRFDEREMAEKILAGRVKAPALKERLMTDLDALAQKVAEFVV